MRSIFDPIEDVDLEIALHAKPRKSWKFWLALTGSLAGTIGAVVGGYVLYQFLFPPPLTQRPLPMTPDKLLVELKEARDDIDARSRDAYGRIEQFNNRQRLLGRKPVSFSQVFLQGLSVEEEQALDELVRQEKDPSYRGVLGQVVEDMKKIRELQTRVAELEGKLPGDGIEAQGGESHERLAREFLMKNHNMPETRAQELVLRLNLLTSRLEKGWRVHFYYDPAKDFFGSWVHQGDARSAPFAVTRARELKLLTERDTAVAMARDLEDKKLELEEILANLETEIARLEERKKDLETSVATLETERNQARRQVAETGAELERQRNLMFYEADLEGNLRARGVLKTFNRVESIGDLKYPSALDLRAGKSITLRPGQFGISRIEFVDIVPRFLKDAKDLSVTIAEDGTAEVTVLNETALRGQKVLFVVN